MTKITEYLRLKENHPVAQKVEKLYALAEELKIKISFSCYGAAIIQDEEHREIRFELLDIEDGSYPMVEFPPSTEYYIRCVNPVWAKEQERIHQEYIKKRDEEEKRLAAEKLEKEATKLQAKKEKLEQEEKQLLKALKEKYPEE